MSKIGLITLYKENYGSILQCFATKSFIESLGNECIVLDSPFKPEILTLSQKILRKAKTGWKMILHPSLLHSFIFKRKYPKYLTHNSYEKMKSFIDASIKPVIVKKGALNDLNWLNGFKNFIVGSDQVWKISGAINPFRFLDFAPINKRITLAVSFGTSNIPSCNKKQVCQLLSPYKYISVREESSVELVKKCSKAKICRIADPTLIYNAEEWRTFAIITKIAPRKYVLVHFLNEPNKVAIDSINWLSKHLNLDVVAVGYKYASFKKMNSLLFVDGGPREYLSLIDNAEYILTDSFHSTLFSINFNKRFFIFHRQYSVTIQTCRITDLLKRFDMGNRLIDDLDVLRKIYLDELPQNSRVFIEKERAIVRNYIQKSISGEIPRCFFDLKEVSL